MWPVDCSAGYGRSRRPTRARGLNLGLGPPWDLSAPADPQPERDRLGARVHADLLVDPAQVVLDRLVRDHELLRDVAVGEPAGEQVEHLALAGGEGPQAL